MPNAVVPSASRIFMNTPRNDSMLGIALVQQGVGHVPTIPTGFA